MAELQLFSMCGRSTWKSWPSWLPFVDVKIL